MKRLAKILVFCLMVFLFSFCKKKYEEDPKRTFKSPQKRIHGQWFLDDFTFNGQSIVNKLNALSKKGFQIQSSFIAAGADNYTNEEHIKLAFDGGAIRCAFNDQFVTIGPMVSGDTIGYPWFITPFHELGPTTATSSEWEITKLYENNLNMTLQTDTGIYKMFFEK